MVISRHTLKRLPTRKKSMMTSGYYGQIKFTKPAAILLNAPCKISFDFDNMTCFLDDNDGFDIKITVNGFYIFSKILTRFINEKFESKTITFEIKPASLKGTFELEVLNKKLNGQS